MTVNRPTTLTEQRLLTKINKAIEKPMIMIQQNTKRMSWENRRIVWAAVLFTAQERLKEMEGNP